MRTFHADISTNKRGVRWMTVICVREELVFSNDQLYITDRLKRVGLVNTKQTKRNGGIVSVRELLNMELVKYKYGSMFVII